MAHNLIAGAFTKVGSGTINGGIPRYTPYHEPHGTRINGFMTILHGDMRFFNNIFLQQKVRDCFREDMERLHIDLNPYAGTFVYDEYPSPEEYEALYADGDLFNYDRYNTHLPVSSQGNVFLNGARPCRTEKEFYCPEGQAGFALEQREDGWYLKLFGMPRLSDMAGRIVDTERMGMAFEPEQLFEEPDGTPVTLDRDYFGALRTEEVLPGPFSRDTDREQKVF